MKNILSSNISTKIPITEGVKYAGSKLKILPHILQLAQETNAKCILDGFSGTTRVGQAFAKKGYQVYSNDISVWSEIFGIAYLLNNKDPGYYKEIIDYLNSLKPMDGWFTENYGGVANGGSSIQQDGFKKPWQIHNTRKLDAILEEIKNLSLPIIDRAVVLTSLILALDKVDSTIGHFTSYLKKWSPRSYKNMILKIPNVFVNKKQNKVFRCDIFDITKDINVDLAYYDPPYGSNNKKMPASRVRYASYYHLWTTVCLNDTPELFGKAKRRKDTSDNIAISIFEEFRSNNLGKPIVVEAIEKLIKKTKSNWIIFSYSSGGKATLEELYEVINCNGELIKTLKLDYRKNVMASMKWTGKWVKEFQEPHQEYLFLIKKKF